MGFFLYWVFLSNSQQRTVKGYTQTNTHRHTHTHTHHTHPHTHTHSHTHQPNLTFQKVVHIHATKAYKGGGGRGIAPLILNLSTRWGWVVNLMPQKVYHREKKTRYVRNRRMSGPQSRSRRFGTEKNLLLILGFELRNVRPVAKSLNRLRYNGS